MALFLACPLQKFSYHLQIFFTSLLLSFLKFNEMFSLHHTLFKPNRQSLHTVTATVVYTINVVVSLLLLGQEDCWDIPSSKAFCPAGPDQLYCILGSLGWCKGARDVHIQLSVIQSIIIIIIVILILLLLLITTTITNQIFIIIIIIIDDDDGDAAQSNTYHYKLIWKISSLNNIDEEENRNSLLHFRKWAGRWQTGNNYFQQHKGMQGSAYRMLIWRQRLLQDLCLSSTQNTQKTGENHLRFTAESSDSQKLFGCWKKQQPTVRSYIQTTWHNSCSCLRLG